MYVLYIITFIIFVEMRRNQEHILLLSSLRSGQASTSRADTRDNVTRASRSSIRNSRSEGSDVHVNGLSELSTKRYTLLNFLSSTKATETIVGIASLLAFRESLGGFSYKCAALDSDVRVSLCQCKILEKV